MMGLFIFMLYTLQVTAGDSQQALIEYQQAGEQLKFTAVLELAAKQPDEKIIYGDHDLHFGLLWKPQAKTNQPLIVMVHGGCWLNAFGVAHTYPMATALAQYGFPVWSLEYRRTGDPGGTWPGSFDDIKLALSQLNHLHEFGINTNNYVLMGHSAGGHLALLAASELTANLPQQIIGLAAITDVSRYAMGQNSCQQAAAEFMGGRPNEQPTAYQQASLVYRNLPKQTILLHGDADNIVPLLQSQLHHVNFEVVEGAGHFDWIHPGAHAFQKLLYVLNNKP